MDTHPAVETFESPPTLETDEAGVSTIRLNRPRHHNRLEPGDVRILRDIITRIEATPAIRVAILAASGKTFSAGYDLADLGTPGGEHANEGIAILAETIDALERCRVPTIAVLNGPVHGGGTDLALACDLRIGTPACRMTMPAARFGLHYYHGGMRRYVSRLGLGPAKRLFLLGETLDADAMRDIGYLDDILPDAEALAARARAMADAVLAAADPGVIASMKRGLNRIAAGEMDPMEADAAWRRTRRSPDVGKAVAAARARTRQ
jgi:enoyl-CoA hydratase/carnithine racemase